jgi:hypothetical protein
MKFILSSLLIFGIAQDEERAVCDCLNPFDVIAVAFARHLFIGALLILGDVPEVRGDIVADKPIKKPGRHWLKARLTMNYAE